MSASLARTFELHGFANIETRAVEPLDRLAKGGEIDKEIYVLRRMQATDAGDDTGLGMHFDLTVPFARYVLENAGTSSSRSAASRSNRPGAVSGRRRAATASSPRPTSTSSAATSCPSTTTWR